MRLNRRVMRNLTMEEESVIYDRFVHLMWCPDRRREWLPWCAEHFGPEVILKDPATHARRWIDAEDAVYFRYDEDAFAFKMRWG